MVADILGDALEQRPPAVLYHYTTQEGLLGIVRAKEMWATHTQHLNDRQEYIHALGIAHEEIERLIKKGGDKKVRGYLAAMLSAVDGSESWNICVCSFSEERDSLSQWRAYSGGGPGFSLGFKGRFLSRLATTHNFSLAPCIYDTRLQRQMISALIKEVLDQNRASPPADRGLPPDGNFGAYLHRYAPILKHPKFAEEKEWRLISRPLSARFEQFDVRPGRSMPSPFYKLGLQKEDLTFELQEVVIGPTPHLERSRAAVQALLINKSVWRSKERREHVPIIGTEVPYRNW